jgi:hypothetical protein
MDSGHQSITRHGDFRGQDEGCPRVRRFRGRCCKREANGSEEIQRGSHVSKDARLRRKGEFF